MYVVILGLGRSIVELSAKSVESVKNNIRTSTDILWRVFHILTEPVLYMSAAWDPALHYAVDLRIQAYGTGYVKISKMRRKISVDMCGYFTVQSPRRTKTRISYTTKYL